MFVVDGAKKKTFCQNLCYLAKLSLDHKTLFVRALCMHAWHSVILPADTTTSIPSSSTSCESTTIVGYFSKEKESEDAYVTYILLCPFVVGF